MLWFGWCGVLETLERTINISGHGQYVTRACVIVPFQSEAAVAGAGSISAQFILLGLRGRRGDGRHRRVMCNERQYRQR